MTEQHLSTVPILIRNRQASLRPGGVCFVDAHSPRGLSQATRGWRPGGHHREKMSPRWESGRGGLEGHPERVSIYAQVEQQMLPHPLSPLLGLSSSRVPGALDLSCVSWQALAFRGLSFFLGPKEECTS